MNSVQSINNINCVIASVDGVLYDAKTKEFVRNKQLVSLIKNFVKRNNKFIICGCHNLVDIETTYKHFGIYDFCPYSVACNGSLIFDNFRRQKISHRYLTKSIINAAEELQEIFHREKIPIALLGYDGYNCIKISKSEMLPRNVYREMIKTQGGIGKNNFINTGSLEDELPLVKLVWKTTSASTIKSAEIYHRVVDYFNKLIVKPAIINDQLNDHVEVNMIGNEKTNAITELVDLLKINPQNCMLVGNGRNDSVLFNSVGVSVVKKSNTLKSNVDAKIVLNASKNMLLLKALMLLN